MKHKHMFTGFDPLAPVRERIGAAARAMLGLA
jgi:hypothetical protein